MAEHVDHGVSGAQDSRPALDEMLANAQAGRVSVIMIWKLDRLARSLQHLLRMIAELDAWGVALVSIRDPGMDLTTSAGRLMMQLLGAVSEFERSLIVERVRAGVARAQAAGVHCGRPRRDIDMRVVNALLSEGRSVRETAGILGVPRSTLQKHLREAAEAAAEGGQQVPRAGHAEDAA